MISRRTFLLTSAALAAGAFALKPRAGVVTHDAYFTQLSQALRAAGVGSPMLVLDRARMQHNLDTIAAQVGQRRALRVVTKSLPCMALLDHTMQAWQTQRQMVFNYPMLHTLLHERPEVDLLLGKPLDAIELPRFFAEVADREHAARQIQWLVDTPTTLQQYLAFARAQRQTMRINIEIDVGLHRGGVADRATFNTMLDLLAAEPLAQFSGLMGYEPHIVKVPDVLGNRSAAEAHAKQTYQAFLDAAYAHPAGHIRPEQWTLNTAGSPTYRLHIEDSPARELAIGSAVVKPSDFDTPLLEPLQAAMYIAAPILKVGEFSLPYGAERISHWSKKWDVNQAKSVIIHGGEWLAHVASPAGVQPSGLYGHSTNQKMLTAQRDFAYGAGDYVFFRPTQSEMLMLQFGQIAVLEQGAISALWPTLNASA